MGFYEDYVADGLCCQCCGEYLGDGEPGYARFCAACDPDNPKRRRRKETGEHRGRGSRRP